MPVFFPMGPRHMDKFLIMTKFPKKLRLFFLDFFAKFDAQNREIEDHENISRFIFYSRHFKNKFKNEALLPNPKDNVMSVYRTSKCGEEKIWWLGKNFVENRRPDDKELRGRGDFLAVSIKSENHLSFQPLNKPHPRHVNIIGWPLEKDQKKAIAIDLLAFVTFIQIPQRD